MAQAALLWAAAALLLLGAAAGACVRCRLRGARREERRSERRTRLGNPQSFEVIRSRSVLATTRRLEQNKEWENSPVPRKSNEELGAARRVGSEARAESRYQNFLKEDQLHEEAAYVDPISWDYYNWMNPVSAHEKEEDSYSYQNVIVGARLSSSSVTDDTGDYENSTAIHIWTLQQDFEVSLKQI
ncbi:linker for activation of T-cells family member 2 [Eudromia elegans]